METKRQFKYFSIVDYEKEQDYLREMHKSGWKLKKVSGLCMYHFEKCTPEDVVYQLDYNQEGIEHKDEYLKLFNDCGWEYIQDYVGYSYFRKPASDEGTDEEIFCDEDSRLQMMNRIMKGRMLPLLIIFLSVLLPQFMMNLSNHSSPLYRYATALTGAVIVLYVVIFIIFAVKYSKYKNNLKK